MKRGGLLHSINLMTLSAYKRLGLGEVSPITITLQLADRSMVFPKGVVEDVLVKGDKFIFLADFIVLDIEEDIEVPLIMGRPFLATGRALIDVAAGELIIRVNNQEVTFNIFKAMDYPKAADECFAFDVIESAVGGLKNHVLPEDPLEAAMLVEEVEEINEEIKAMINWFDSTQSIFPSRQPFESLDLPATTSKVNRPSCEVPPILELKQLPNHLRYAFLGNDNTLPVIISALLTPLQEEKLLIVMRDHLLAIGWTIADIRGISPSFCMHKILLEDDYKATVEHQRRLNPIMKEVVKKEIIKWLDAGIIYPISDSEWVSPVQCVPKKGGITVVANEKNELIPTRAVTGWRICMDYRKLNKATRKDHFPLPFVDQMLDRVAGMEYYCFLDGYSGYNQIVIAQIGRAHV